MTRIIFNDLNDYSYLYEVNKAVMIWLGGYTNR